MRNADETASGNQPPAATWPRRMTSHANARARGRGAHWTGAYLRALETSLGQKIKAASAAGVTPRTVQRRRKIDAGFAAEERERMEVVKDAVESEITRRAIEGVTRKRYDRSGKLISQEIEYSDVLLLRLAERTETGSWRQKPQIEHSGGVMFKTRAERKEALAQARAALHQRVVTAGNGQSEKPVKRVSPLWRPSGVSDHG